jgi:hypothetical protein
MTNDIEMNGLVLYLHIYFHVCQTNKSPCKGKTRKSGVSGSPLLLIADGRTVGRCSISASYVVGLIVFAIIYVLRRYSEYDSHNLVIICRVTP